MSTSKTLLLNGAEVEFNEGDTVLEVAQSAGEEIMTLCHDPRLKPVGACRTCLVEIKGWRRLTASCATKAEAGMDVTCKNERIERHQKALLSLYLSDNVSEEATFDSADASQLHSLAAEAGAETDWPRMEAQRFERMNDRNPYVQFRADRCILCARCTRYCEEVESVSAISLAGRGSATTIATADSRSLLDTSCELCGGCIAVCPTGAMTEKKPLLAMLKPARELEKVRTTCNYCGVGCQMDLNVDRTANEGTRKNQWVNSKKLGLRREPKGWLMGFEPTTSGITIRFHLRVNSAFPSVITLPYRTTLTIANRFV
jgi:NADH dehydrogenase/NADH:ubiquinone oxidoreductase subunit G